LSQPRHQRQPGQEPAALRLRATARVQPSAGIPAVSALDRHGRPEHAAVAAPCSPCHSCAASPSHACCAPAACRRPPSRTDSAWASLRRTSRWTRWTASTSPCTPSAARRSSSRSGRPGAALAAKSCRCCRDTRGSMRATASSCSGSVSIRRTRWQRCARSRPSRVDAAAYNRRMPPSSHRHELYTVAQVRALDRRAIEVLGVPGFELMRRAAWAALSSLRRHWPQARRIAVHCGPGNNGGDGFLLATLAREAGLHVDVLALGEASSGDAGAARQAWRDTGGSVRLWQIGDALPEADVHVDALYGTGLRRAPEPPVAALIEAINASGVPVLALDVPSGLDADTGHVPGAAIRAAVTVSFIAAKRGLHTGRAAAFVGALELDALGLPESLWQGEPADAQLLTATQLPPRARDAHKGTNGHVLAIGGEHGMGGAIRLCGEAALRTGAGLVSVATRTEHIFALNAARPELMAHGVDGPQALEPLLARASVLALGPGLGQGAWSHALWLTALDSGKPLVLDADGLNLLTREPRRFTQPAVLTPHPGEAARLLGGTVA